MLLEDRLAPDDADEPVPVVHHRILGKVSPHHVLHGGLDVQVGAQEEWLAQHDLSHRLVALGEDQLAEDQHADQPAVVVDDVAVGDERLPHDLPHALQDRGDGLVRREDRSRHLHEPAHAMGRGGVVAQPLLPALPGDAAQHGLALLVRQLPEGCNGEGRRRFRQHARRSWRRPPRGAAGPLRGVRSGRRARGAPRSEARARRRRRRPAAVAAGPCGLLVARWVRERRGRRECSARPCGRADHEPAPSGWQPGHGRAARRVGAVSSRDGAVTAPARPGFARGSLRRRAGARARERWRTREARARRTPGRRSRARTGRRRAAPGETREQLIRRATHGRKRAGCVAAHLPVGIGQGPAQPTGCSTARRLVAELLQRQHRHGAHLFGGSSARAGTSAGTAWSGSAPISATHWHQARPRRFSESVFIMWISGPVAEAAAGPISKSAIAATERTKRWGSSSDLASAGTATSAAGPMPPSAPAALLRTPMFGSARASTNAGTAGQATGPSSRKAMAAPMRSSGSALWKSASSGWTAALAWGGSSPITRCSPALARKRTRPARRFLPARTIPAPGTGSLEVQRAQVIVEGAMHRLVGVDEESAQLGERLQQQPMRAMETLVVGDLIREGDANGLPSARASCHSARKSRCSRSDSSTRARTDATRGGVSSRPDGCAPRRYARRTQRRGGPGGRRSRASAGRPYPTGRPRP